MKRRYFGLICLSYNIADFLFDPWRCTNCLNKSIFNVPYSAPVPCRYCGKGAYMRDSLLQNLSNQLKVASAKQEAESA